MPRRSCWLEARRKLPSHGGEPQWLGFGYLKNAGYLDKCGSGECFPNRTGEGNKRCPVRVPFTE